MRIVDFFFNVTKPYKKYILGCFSCIIVAVLCSGSRPYFTKMLVDIIGSGGDLWQAGAFLIATYIIIPLNWRAYDWCSLSYEPNLKNTIAKTLFSQVSKHNWSYFQNNFVGSISSKITDITSMIPTMLSTVIHAYFANFLSIIIAIIALSSINLWFGVGMFIWSSFIITISIITVSRFNNLSRNVAEKSSIIIAHIVDCLTNILNIKLFANIEKEIKNLEISQENYRKKSLIRRINLFKFYGIQGATFAIYQIFCFLLLVKLFSQERVSGGDFVMILMINSWIIDSIWQASEQMRTFSENWGSVEQGLSTLYTEISGQDIDHAKTLEVQKGEIIFDKVNFEYPGTPPLFNNKSLIIEAGKKIGLVGYSGSGKSTFVNLILRLYEVKKGKILIDGQDIQNVTADSLHKSISFIPQDPTLFHRSIRENIAYGNLNAGEKEIIEAAKAAGAHHFIEDLPNKYDSYVGERGVKLSGGQRQRISIARAFLKNAPILILDEATSQLDSITEEKIQESLKELMDSSIDSHSSLSHPKLVSGSREMMKQVQHDSMISKTTIVIAHRLSTLLNMDRILVFDNGKIIQDGTHKELIKQKGLYKNMWEAQVCGFLPEKSDT